MPDRLVNTPTFYVKNRTELRDWLSKNYTQKQSHWLIYDKQKDGIRALPYGEIVDELLCYGWIDGLARRLNDVQSMLLVSPRKPKSVWSKINKDKVEKLIESGMMTEYGMIKINTAKADGSWAAYDDVDNLVIPVDLEKALTGDLIAKKNFEVFSDSSKKVILFWIMSAKTAETRQKRIEKTVQMAAKNLRANQDKMVND